MRTFQYYIDAFRHYFDFHGKTSKKAFWFFVLYHIIISLMLSFISEDLYNVYSLIVFIPSLAISVRRLHDIGKSGWWVLIGLIPIIGWIWLFILYLQDGVDEKKEEAKRDEDHEEEPEGEEQEEQH